MRQARKFTFGFLALVVLFIAVRSASAHAVLVESSPAINTTVRGPDVAIRLRFNARIDANRSRLILALPDGSTRPLEIDKETPADTLTTQAAGLKPGQYTIRWQVLAADGHMTRGEIPFTVGRR